MVDLSYTRPGFVIYKRKVVLFMLWQFIHRPLLWDKAQLGVCWIWKTPACPFLTPFHIRIAPFDFDVSNILKWLVLLQPQKLGAFWASKPPLQWPRPLPWADVGFLLTFITFMNSQCSTWVNINMAFKVLNVFEIRISPVSWTSHVSHQVFWLRWYY